MIRPKTLMKNLTWVSIDSESAAILIILLCTALLEINENHLFMHFLQFREVSPAKNFELRLNLEDV
ncbi:hypothetical protein SAMD00079811_77200 (plasmid) [Scytonema sp. HK-05]|nr:hypothetical protein SAMD00079811_77200 [Scytonema sp. HK-05]